MLHACVTRTPFTIGLTPQRPGVGTLACCKSVPDELNATNERHTLKSRNATQHNGESLAMHEPQTVSLMMWRRILDKCASMSGDE